MAISVGRPGLISDDCRRIGFPRVSTQTVFVSIVVLALATLYFVPIVRMLSFGFVKAEVGVSLEAFQRVFGSEFYVYVIFNTVRISAIVTFVCAVLAYPVSYLMIQVNGRVLQLVLFCVMLPLWMSVVVKTYAWLVILQQNGIVNAVLQGLGVVDRPLSLVFGDFAVIIGSIHMMLPFMILPIYAALRRIDPSYYKAATGLGAKPSRAFLHVILPLSLPGMAAGSLIVFVLELGFFVTPAILGGGRVLMIAPIIQKQVDSFSNWGLVAILSVILLAIAITAVILSDLLFRRVRGAK